MPKSEQSPSPEDIIKEGEREAQEGFEEYAQKTVWEKLLRDAMKKKQKVEVYGTGTYKGVIGLVVSIKYGHVYIDTPVALVVIGLKDIKRVAVYKPEVEE